MCHLDRIIRALNLLYSDWKRKLDSHANEDSDDEFEPHRRMLKYYNTNNLRPSINSYEPNEVNGINQLITNDSSITNYDLLRRSQIVEYAADTSVVKLEK